MKKAKWNEESIRKKCIDIGIEFLDDYYHHSKKNNFKCSCGNMFERLFSNVLKNQIFCKECESNRKNILKEKILKEKFNELNELVKSNNQILLSKLSDYKGNKSKMTIVCNCGGLFNPTANNYKRNHIKCRKCGTKDSKESRTTPIETLMEVVEKENYTFIDAWHIKNSGWRMLLSCENDKHKDFEVAWSNFKTGGTRCPTCNLSRGERKVAKFLEGNNIPYHKEYVIEELKGSNGGIMRFDFMIEDDNEITLIEYDGIQHYIPKFGEKEFKRIQDNDRLKNEYCEDKKIKLLRIPYWEFDNVENILKEYIIYGNTEIIGELKNSSTS